MKKRKPDIGVFIDPEGNHVLELYDLSYNKQFQRIDIRSHKYKCTFGISAMELLKLIDQNKEILFGDF